MTYYYVGGREYYLRNELQVVSTPSGPYSQFKIASKFQRYIESLLGSVDYNAPFVSEIAPSTLQI